MAEHRPASSDALTRGETPAHVEPGYLTVRVSSVGFPPAPLAPNAGHEPRPEAEAQRKLEGVGLHALVRLGLCVWMPLLLYPALSPLRSRIKKSRGHPIYYLTRGDRAANASSTTCSLICSMPNPARVAAIT
jgi:hypothetical protein